jgi:hypothetical protein
VGCRRRAPGDDKRIVESDIFEEDEAAAVARDYAAQAMAAGRPLVGLVVDDA